MRLQQALQSHRISLLYAAMLSTPTTDGRHFLGGFGEFKSGLSPSETDWDILAPALLSIPQAMLQSLLLPVSTRPKKTEMRLVICCRFMITNIV
jgi:hypothetical protein